MTVTADNLRRLGAKHKRLRDDLDALRPDLAAAIQTAAAEGMRQVDIVKATGYTREAVRRLVEGLDRAGRRPS